MAEVTRIDIDDPDVDMDQGQRVLYRGELFTGEAEERLGGVVVSLDSYVAACRTVRAVSGTRTARSGPREQPAWGFL